MDHKSLNLSEKARFWCFQTLSNLELEELERDIKNIIQHRQDNILKELAENWDKNTVWCRLVVPLIENNLSEFSFDQIQFMLRASLKSINPERSESEIEEFIEKAEEAGILTDQDENELAENLKIHVGNWFNEMYLKKEEFSIGDLRYLSFEIDR